MLGDCTRFDSETKVKQRSKDWLLAAIPPASRLKLSWAQPQVSLKTRAAPSSFNLSACLCTRWLQYFYMLPQDPFWVFISLCPKVEKEKCSWWGLGLHISRCRVVLKVGVNSAEQQQSLLAPFLPPPCTLWVQLIRNRFVNKVSINASSNYSVVNVLWVSGS